MAQQGTLSPFTIREAMAADVPVILAFVHALAIYEREPDAVEIGEVELLRDGFGAEPRYACLIAEQDGVAAGIALYFRTYSTWTGAGVHLEDLFVLPEFRGLGIGKALITRVAAITQAQGCKRLQWNVLDWNTPAVEFYEGLGAHRLEEWRIMRVTGDKLAALAAQSTAGAEG